jgi:hypothetical protein
MMFLKRKRRERREERERSEHQKCWINRGGRERERERERERKIGPADSEAEVTADGPRGGVVRVGGPHQLAAALDDIVALPHHGDDGTC